jgi:hypothetical protein
VGAKRFTARHLLCGVGGCIFPKKKISLWPARYGRCKATEFVVALNGVGIQENFLSPLTLLMRQLVKILSLLLVLLVAQQGAVDHELGHLARAASHNVNAAVLDPSCAQCPAFAQASSPAFSYTFHLPLLVLGAVDQVSAVPSTLINAAVLEPRSRGPPSRT